MKATQLPLYGLLLMLCEAYFPVAAADSVTALAFRVAKVVTMDDHDSVFNNAVVLVKDGVIERVGKSSEIQIPPEYRVVDKPQLWLVPGLIDCHNHSTGSLSDLNDSVYLTNPGLDSRFALLPESDNNKRSVAGGVTTVLLIPGSATNMGGFGTITKTSGDSVDEMVVRSPGSLKIAQAGNPERYWYGVGRSFMNFNTRQTLRKARDYHLKWRAYEQAKAAGEDVSPPPYDAIFAGFRGLFDHTMVASVHTQMYQVVMMTCLMVSEEFQIRTVLDHCTFDAWKVAPIVLRNPLTYTINGPRQFHFDRTQRKMMGNAARWWQGGVRKLGINTDAPVVPEENLPYQAAMACWYGWQAYPALKGITKIPAEALMVDDRIGSIQAGKEAEFGLWTGDPVDPRSSCEMTVIRGKIVYEAEKGRVY